MSDKSFGDHTTRNIVKNPLLSTAVTGLSLEDLTHKAVLLPVTPSLGQITRSDQQQGSQSRTLGHADLETPTLPSGDAFSNITLTNIDQTTNLNIINSQNNVKLENNRGSTTATQSQASLKSDDDFDVNEYIARLQGSRYVSAPLRSHLKEDQKASLEATEENLEEINLNESQGPVEVQQSLTADIAQNFSQLPTVLPHVASAVFSSFSNMLNYKGREQTPDTTNVVPEPASKGYDEVQFQTPDVGISMMGMEEYAPKEVAPPPKEPPIGGCSSSYRIATKKKYAQIPGLSSGDPAQTMTFNEPRHNIHASQNMPPTGQNMPLIAYNMPPIDQNITGFTTPIGQNVIAVGENLPPLDHTPSLGPNVPFGQSMPPHAQYLPPASMGNVPPVAQAMPPFVPSVAPVGQNEQSIGPGVPTIFNPNEARVHDGIVHVDTNADPQKAHEFNINTQNVAASQYNLFNPNAAVSQVETGVAASGSQPYTINQTNQNFFSPIEHKEQPQNIPNVQGSGAIIPPPPMFSNWSRSDGQSHVGKSILPPSVTRRISANQPCIKPAAATPSFNENIFVPASVPEAGESLDQAGRAVAAGIPSIFVPENPASSISDQFRLSSGTPSSLQTTPSSFSQTSTPFFVPSNLDKSETSQATEYHIPSVESPKTSNDTPTATALFMPDLTSSIATTSKASTLPPTNNNIAFGLIATDTASNIRSTNEPTPPLFAPGPSILGSANAPGPSVFNPGTSVHMQTPHSISSSNIQPSPHTNPPPTPFYNPLQHGEYQTKEKLQPITQPNPSPILESPKTVAEPPKATGNVNFRMAKRRPQYYAGPIEGVGDISNNVKPVIAPVVPTATEASKFQGALFTPEQPIQPIAEQYATSDLRQASEPFDISRPVDNVPTIFDISQPQETYGVYQQKSEQQDYNSAFDMSRATTDMYDPPKQESRGFGIIGSLKSKLSSIDINKIQSTVTTFFDPAYNDTKVGESSVHENAPYGNQQQFGQQQQTFATQGQSSFDIFVPNIEQNQYSQYQHNYDYNTNQYYQQQNPYAQSQGQNVYPMSSYQSPNYSSEQTYTTSHSYGSTQELAPNTSYTDDNIPINFETSSTENTAFYNPDNFTQHVTKPHQPHLNIAPENEDRNKSDTTACKAETTGKIENYNLNVFSEETQQIPTLSQQQTFDVAPSFLQTIPEQAKHVPTTVLSENIQEPTFYNPNAFTHGNPPQVNKDSNIHETFEDTQIESHATFDSALNTSKYNFSSIQPPETQQNVPSAASFFDMPGNVNQSQFSVTSHTHTHDLVKNNKTNVQQQFGYVDLNKTSTTMSPIGTKSKKNIDSKDDIKQPLKENTLIESLSKEEIPILGVSTVPLFGLSAMTADTTRETTESENLLKNLSFGIQTPINLNQDKNVGSEKRTPGNYVINDNQAKEVNITGLNISAVKNVLLIEPPQENIGTVLKMNASSGKLENVQNPEEPRLRQQIDDNLIKSYFDHDSEKTTDKELKHVRDESHSQELDICETCREVNTPDTLAKEDVTTQMIENITSRMALSNAVTVPFTESDAPIEERSQFDEEQLDEITRIASHTMTTILVQSATSLLDDQITTSEGHGWTTEDAAYLASQDTDYNYQIEATLAGLADNDYKFKLDPNASGFYGNNSLFFENLPTNASDEIKAEIKSSHEDVVLPRQISIPSAPPVEDDTKSDETGGLDVHSIEQDANKDFPIEEEFVIEPSETDDDKIEFRERKQSSEDSTMNDTFTNRIERFKKTIDNSNEDGCEQKGSQVYGSQPMSMASYFDTGNYAVESHYRKSLTSPTSINTFIYSGNVMRIPPGFEEEFARRLSGMSLSSGEYRNYYISDPAQAQLTSTSTLSGTQDIKENVIGFEMRKKENSQANAEPLENKSETGNPMNWSQHDQSMYRPADASDPRQVFPSFNDPPIIPTQLDEDAQNVKSVPNTTTQTQIAFSPSYSSPLEAKENIVGFEMRRKENIEAYSQAIGMTKIENVQYSTDFSDTAQVLKCCADQIEVTRTLEQDIDNIKFEPNTSTQTKLANTTTFSSSLDDSETVSDSVLKFTGFDSPVTVGPKLDEDLENVKSVPNTTTQTSIAFSTTYSSPDYTKQNIVGAEIRRKENIEQVEEPPQDVRYIPNCSTQTSIAFSTTYSRPEDTRQNIIGTDIRRNENIKIVEGPPQDVRYIPNCSTQTSIAFSTTYSRPEDTRQNIIESDIQKNKNIKIVEGPPQDVRYIPNTTTQTSVAFSTTYSSPRDTPMSLIGQTVDRPLNTDRVQTFTAFADPTATEPTFINQPNVQTLPDPMNFFSANAPETEAKEEEPQSFNRLAMYFTMPPAQPEHSKSFFELSESQNHYRHETKTQEQTLFDKRQNIDDNTKANIKKLMKDLTSPNNLQEHTVRTVNYFTVEFDNGVQRDVNLNVKLDENKPKVNANKDKTKLAKNKTKCYDVIFSCRFCLNNFPGAIRDCYVRTAMNDTSQPRPSETSDIMPNNPTHSRRSTTVTFGTDDVEGQTQDGVTVMNENRTTSEYNPVKHHWFYRVDVEEKSVWRGFSLIDSKALEDSFRCPDLNENTLVATDGGRYDVNVMGRLRVAVYWKEKPTNVRRCSWFYKGTTDARYVPYTEAVAEKLEEEYRHGITTGEWHRKLSLPNGEMVIMHGPSVMVHFLQSGATDVFSTPPNVLGKRVYRNPPKIRVARDQPPKVDHLILLVHGAGEYKRYPYMEATSRPRVVRRGTEESEIEDPEPSKIDHLLLLCHGVGSACDMRFRSVEEVVEDFRTTSLQLIQSHYRNSYDKGLVSRVEVLPISWHAQLHSGEAGVDRRLSRVTLDSIPRLRAFTNHTVLDVLFYTSPVFHQSIIDTVCFELNRIYSMFKQRNPDFNGDVSLGGHSLGSVILYDLLCHQMSEAPLNDDQSPTDKQYVPGTSDLIQPSVKYPELVFPPAALYALGSPIAIFECIRGVDLLGMDFALPTCKNFFNIFHPYDPIAYRIEPLINPLLQEVKPSQIPHHKGRKRMHLELKDTMARVGADLKQKLMESLRTTWNKWKAGPPNDRQLEKVVEEELEKEQLTEGNKEDPVNEMQTTPEMLGRLNSGRRIDYVLQEAPLEMINEYLFAISSHVGYWESEDTMLLMLREIYSSMGVQADSTVPQQSMTVQRTSFAQNEATIINEKELPSTSRGGT